MEKYEDYDYNENNKRMNIIDCTIYLNLEKNINV